MSKLFKDAQKHGRDKNDKFLGDEGATVLEEGAGVQVISWEGKVEQKRSCRH